MAGPTPWYDQLEPLAQDTIVSRQMVASEDACSLSIAISLKRIADAMTSIDERPGVLFWLRHIAKSLENMP